MIVTVLFILTVVITDRIDMPARGAQFTAIGRQWWWDFDYKDLGFKSPNEIYAPVDRTTSIDVESADVIHSFWVPQMGGKIDMIPGHVNHIHFVPLKTGQYLGECSEFCGVQHGKMRFLFVVVTPEEYTAWVERQQQPAAKPTGAEAVAGEKVIASVGCGSCHAIRGTTLKGTFGPDLTHFGSRRRHRRLHAAQHAREPAALDPGPAGRQARVQHAQRAAAAGSSRSSWSPTSRSSSEPPAGHRPGRRRGAARPARRARRPPRHAERGGLGAWLTTTDHKKIGLMYIGTALVFFLIAVIFAMLMRTQLIKPEMGLLSPQAYNQIFSMHGTTMVFLFGMPILIGLANYLVPLQIGARDMAFPRANALSYWLLLFGGLVLYSSFLFGGALDTGWFSYAPLTLKAYSPHDGVTFWIVSLVLLGGSSILGSINFIVTCLRFRAKGMGLWQMPIFSVATFINSFLILFAFPSLSAALALLYLDRQFGTSFFDPTGGGDPIIWQHLFWFFGHPEVYILILPAFGIMSEVVPVFSRKPLFGRSSMIVMLGVIGFLGFLVWAHHMFATGLPNLFNAIMAGTSMLIAIPTGVKIFNWLATMWGGALRFTTLAALRLRPHRPVHRGRHHRRHAGRRAVGLAGDRHLLRRRPLPQRADRRHGVRRLRRHLLLVPQDDRPVPLRPHRQGAVLAHRHRLRAHLLPDVRARDPGHAAARVHLRAGRRLERR